jgi:hypothetical protein
MRQYRLTYKVGDPAFVFELPEERSKLHARRGTSPLAKIWHRPAVAPA